MSVSAGMQELLVPPINFAMVCPGVYRSGYPTRKNYPFLRALRLRSILYLCPEDYAESNLKFCEESGISVLRYPTEGNKEPFNDIAEPLMHRILSAVCDVRNLPILIHCNKGKHRTGTVVAALRLLQAWSLVSIFAEYKRFAEDKARVSDQQYVELYCPIVRVTPAYVPSWFCRTPRVTVVHSEQALLEAEARQLGHSLLAPPLPQQQQQQQQASSLPATSAGAASAPTTSVTSAVMSPTTATATAAAAAVTTTATTVAPTAAAAGSGPASPLHASNHTRAAVAAATAATPVAATAAAASPTSHMHAPLHASPLSLYAQHTHVLSTTPPTATTTRAPAVLVEDTTATTTATAHHAVETSVPALAAQEQPRALSTLQQATTRATMAGNTPTHAYTSSAPSGSSNSSTDGSVVRGADKHIGATRSSGSSKATTTSTAGRSAHKPVGRRHKATAHNNNNSSGVATADVAATGDNDNSDASARDATRVT